VLLQSCVGQRCGSAIFDEEGFRRRGKESPIMTDDTIILTELRELKAMLAVLVERQTVKAFYEIEEFARLVGKAEFTVRQWCRLGRIRAEKKLSGRGAHVRWAVPHAELLRYQREGLIPLQGERPSQVCWKPSTVRPAPARKS